MKSEALSASPALVCTVILPDAATAGTVVWMLVPVASNTLAVVPLNLTVFWAGSVLKLVPEIVTGVEDAPIVQPGPYRPVIG